MPRYAGGPVAGDLPDDSIEGLTDEVDRIVEDATKAGKIPPARQAKVFDDLIAGCSGTLDRSSVDRFRQQVESMPALVTTIPTKPLQPDEEIRNILAHDFDPGPPGKPPSADWDTWSHIAQCALWEAVILSLGFEPTYFVPIPDGQGALWIVPRRGQQLPIDAALRLLPQDDTRAIHRRLRIALSQPSTVIKSTDHFLAPRSFESTISLPEFGSWAARIWPKDFPPLFPRRDGLVQEATAVTKAKEPAPHWKVYGSYVSATLAQAVALSCDLDPEDNAIHRLAKLEISRTFDGFLDALTLINNPPPHTSDEDVQAKWDEFLRRFKIAINHVQSGTLRTTDRSIEGTVRFADFSAWAPTIGFSLPEEFPGQRPPAGDSSADASTLSRSGPWPWGTYETANLKFLAAAAKHFWADGYDPASAPTSERVIGWLEGEGASQRVATIIAQILRPPDVPTGPREKKSKK